MNMNTIKLKIEKLEDYYEYSQPYDNEIHILKQLDFPADYINFINHFGIGLILQDILNLWGEPENADEIYDLIRLKNYIVFGENLSGEMFAFDKITWKVVELSASGDILEEYLDFEDFINQYLSKILDSFS